MGVEVEVAVVGEGMVVAGQTIVKNIVEVLHRQEGVAAVEVEVEVEEAVGEVVLEEEAAVEVEVGGLEVVAVGAEEEGTVKWRKLIRFSACLVLFRRWIFNELLHPDQRSGFGQLTCRKHPCRYPR